MKRPNALYFVATMAWNFLAIHGLMSLAGVGDVRKSVEVTAVVAVAALITTVLLVRRGHEIRF
ncbi:MAG: hypothetical protein HY084_03430 [Gemmatimonadetes bacterium]|nr:hypothetical protein [Gemmatimonadota bacterium]